MNRKLAADIAIFITSQICLYYGVKWVISQMDPMRGKKDESKSKARLILERLHRESEDLNEYEHIIASEIVHHDDIQVSFADVGGLDPIIESLTESVIYPLTLPTAYMTKSNILGPPKGVLLYGPPGTGKTMLAKALAKESGAVFINLHISTLTEKWFGESQKLVHAVFSLARKVQPAIIFIDEIDSFLRERQSSDHEVTGMMKAEFMSMWDGLASSNTDRILVVGATNRFSDIDRAILRRMPKRFPIALPDESQRLDILHLLLNDIDVEDRNNVLRRIAKVANGYSGSDLKELCRNAMMMPMREHYIKVKNGSERTSVRPLSYADFEKAYREFTDGVYRSAPVYEEVE
jgi:ATPase family AAA domain-containing protein 1